MELNINFSQILAQKANEKKFYRYITLEYPIDLYMRGVEKVGERKAVIPFSLETTTIPELAVFSIKGELIVEGSLGEVEKLAVSSEGKPPKIWNKIYQESINLLAVLAKIIEIPFLMPKIVDVTIGR